MMSQSESVLVIGYGNPGRLDDALGPMIAAALENKHFERVTIDSDYQLCVEDAADIAAHDVVIFVDADTSGPAPFWFAPVTPRKEMGFSSHSISPEALLDMARNLLGGHTRGYMLGVRGYEFNEFGERLSEKAAENFQTAVAFLERLLVEKSFDDYACIECKQAAAATGDVAVEERRLS